VARYPFETAAPYVAPLIRALARQAARELFRAAHDDAAPFRDPETGRE
jgi:hypothetical protein